ncbi:MAG: hypothetical protein WA584_08040 [Pyrinomonadaceae bacterium]
MKHFRQFKAQKRILNRLEIVGISEEIKKFAPEGVYVYNAQIAVHHNYCAGGKRVHNLKQVDL